MASKSQTIDIFRSFKSLVENMLNPKIKAVQSDGGGEFTSHWFRTFLSSNGISHRISCPYTPEQNGVTEPKCCHVVEIGLTLLAHVSMPIHFWSEAFSTTTYLINRFPSKVLNNVSPWEKLFGHAPNYVSLCTFGCLWYPFSRPYNNNKLEFRSTQCVFIGYSLNHKEYKCLDRKSGRTFMSVVMLILTKPPFYSHFTTFLCAYLFLFYHNCPLFLSWIVVRPMQLICLLPTLV